MKDQRDRKDEMQVASLSNDSNRSFPRVLAGLCWSGHFFPPESIIKNCYTNVLTLLVRQNCVVFLCCHVLRNRFRRMSVGVAV